MFYSCFLCHKGTCNFSIRHQTLLATEGGYNMFPQSLVKPAVHIGTKVTICACLLPTAMVLLPLYCFLYAKLF